MRVRFPLSLKFAVGFVVNLLLLAAGAYLLFRVQLRQGFDAWLSGAAGVRVQAVAEVVTRDLREQPSTGWNEVLTRFGKVYGVTFHLYSNEGEPLAGAVASLPEEVRAKLVFGRRGGGRPGQPPPFDEGGGPGPGGRPPRPPGPPGEMGFPGGDEMPPPPPGSSSAGRDYPKFMVRTSGPVTYWAGVRLPLSTMRSHPPVPCTLLLRSDTLSGGGLFVETGPWVWAGLGALAFSVLFWLPLVRGLTRSLGRVTEATGRVARGDFAVHVPDDRADELGVLAVSVNDMASQLDRLVGGQRRFLGDVAHELCSPIARMQAALGILEHQVADEKQRGYVDRLGSELQRMSALVNELLSFSKASQARAVTLTPVPLAALVQRAVAVEAAGSAVRVEVAPELTVQADEALLLRAVSNVVRNAVRYAGEAGPIVVRAERQRDRVALVVEDEGPGVSEAALPRLFDAFYRPDEARTREAGGTGLGLAIVKSAVESCEGTVTARRRDPRGLAVEMLLMPGVTA